MHAFGPPWALRLVAHNQGLPGDPRPNGAKVNSQAREPLVESAPYPRQAPQGAAVPRAVCKMSRDALSALSGLGLAPRSLPSGVRRWRFTAAPIGATEVGEARANSEHARAWLAARLLRLSAWEGTDRMVQFLTST